MTPLRFSTITYNIWADARWPEREPGLRAFMSTFVPDILCLQEARPASLKAIDECLTKHARIHDDLPGWTCEGNIYWNTELFEEQEHGAEDVGMLELKRRLFWVRLNVKATGKKLLVATAHFTYQGHPNEVKTGLSPRVHQTRQTIENLNRIVGAEEPALFMGDLNDPVHPHRMLDQAGYVNCFKALGLPALPTHPARPTSLPKFGFQADQAIDWVVANKYLRPISACVPHFYYEDLAPSDHWPILAMYESI